MGSSRSLVAGTVLVAGLALWTPAANGAATPRTIATPKTCRQLVKSEVITSGKLTVATNNPALWPWFVNNNPPNGKGYESVVAFQIGGVLGFKASAVDWQRDPYEFAVQPGKKDFDFDINEITYSKKLANNVTFSSSYFTVNESLVALKTDKIVGHHTPTELRGYLYGAVAGSPGLGYLKKRIEPTKAPIVYKSMAAAIQGLESHAVDALMVDTPTGHYLVSQQLTGAAQFGQFHANGTYYAVVLQKGNPLVDCVNIAISQIHKSGQLSKDSKRWLAVYNNIPFLKP